MVSFQTELYGGGDVRDVPKVVWMLAAGLFVNMVVAFTFVYLFVYLTGPRGLGVREAGLIAGVGGVGLVAGNFTGGWFGDRFGHRATLLTGSLVSGAGLLALPALPTAALFGVLPLCQYAAGAVRAANGALVAVAVPPGARRQGFAVMRFAANAGFTVGPPLGALIAGHFSYSWLFLSDGLGTLFFAGYAAWILPAPHPTARRPTARPAAVPGTPAREVGGTRVAGASNLWGALRARPAVLLLLAAVLVTDTVYRQQYTTLPVFLADHGIGTSTYGWLLAVNGGVILCAELPVTLALRDRAPLRIVGTGLVLVGFGFGALTLGAQAVTAFAMMLLVTAGEILYKTTATAYVADASPGHLQGRFQSLYSGASISGTVLAAPLGAALYAAAPNLLWPACAGLAGLAGLTLLAVRPGRAAVAPAAAPGTAAGVGPAVDPAGTQA